MQAAVITFPGSNRDSDVARALHRASGRLPHAVWHADHALPAHTDLVVLPGGFSYGDYLRCGAIAGHANIMAAVRAHARRGGLVLGICNGFQILVEAGLLPGVLMRNAGLSFVCRRQFLRVERSDTAFTAHYRSGQVIDVCIAHGEGNFAADPATLERLEGEGRVAFRYCDAAGTTSAPANPNGSAHAIAGLYSEGLNVLGLMPHPENFIDDLAGGRDGLALFESLAAFRAGPRG
jgi:phosphoribosylformylglycinamidine synthase I